MELLNLGSTQESDLFLSDLTSFLEAQLEGVSLDTGTPGPHAARVDFGNDLSALCHENRGQFADILSRRTGYVPQDQLLVDFIEAFHAGKPLLIEGERGAGKTAFVKALAQFLGVPFFRVQCMEGIDRAEILFRWDRDAQDHFVRQALSLGKTLEDARAGMYAMEFLLPGTILQAHLYSERHRVPAVLLLDEIDKLPPSVEDMILQVLEERSVSIPNFPGGVLGSVTVHPLVFLTSNGMRHDVSSPLRSRCCYTFVEKPTPVEEMEILRARVPGASPRLVSETVAFLQELRHSPTVQDKPGLREAIPFLDSVVRRRARRLTVEVMNHSLSHLIKRVNDLNNVRMRLAYFEQLISNLVPGENRATQSIPVCRVTQANPIPELEKIAC